MKGYLTYKSTPFNKHSLEQIGLISAPCVSFPPGDSELTHAYIQDETDSCLRDSGSNFGEMCHHHHHVHSVHMDTCDGRELNPETSHPRSMSEEPEQSEDPLCPCRAVDSGWSSNQWPSLPPPCCHGVYQSR